MGQQLLVVGGDADAVAELPVGVLAELAGGVDEAEDVVGVGVEFQDERAGDPVRDGDDTARVLVLGRALESEGDVELLRRERLIVVPREAVDELLGGPIEPDVRRRRPVRVEARLLHAGRR